MINTSPHAAVYIAEGWRVVPVAPGEKNPASSGRGWQHRLWAAEDFVGKNVGVILGHVSRHLTDIDLDCPEAIILAPAFLPPTLTFGHASKPRSHWLYYAEGARAAKLRFGTGQGQGLIEIRATNARDNECGHQTVFPGSVHERTGEAIEFDSSAEAPAAVNAGELRWAVQKLTLACGVLNGWTEDSGRHTKTKAVAGGLLKAGWGIDEVRHMLEQVREAAGHTGAHADNCAHAVESTIEAFGNGGVVTGFGSLVAELGWPEDAVRRLERLARPPAAQLLVAEIASTDTRMGEAKRQELIAEALEADGLAAVGAFTAALAMAPAPTTGPETIANRRIRLAERGPRMLTGAAWADKCLRGKGVRAGEIVIVGGQPGAGKTTALLDMADSLAVAGHPVVWAACDEGPEGIDTRRLQLRGADRDAAEAGIPDAAVIAAMAAADAVPFALIDQPTLEQAAEMACSMSLQSQRPAWVFIDAIQDIRVAAAGSGDSAKDRVDLVLNRLKEFRCLPVVWVCLSKIVRGAYRTAESAESVDDIAAFKESGDIEYGADVAFIFRKTSTPGTIRVTVPKTRIGEEQPAQYMRLDRERARFVLCETPIDVVEPTVDRGASRRAMVAARAQEIAAFVAREPVGVRENDIRTAFGRGDTTNHAQAAALEQQWIHWRAGHRRFFAGPDPRLGASSAVEQAVSLRNVGVPLDD